MGTSTKRTLLRSVGAAGLGYADGSILWRSSIGP